MKENKRLEVINQALARRITVKEASELLQLSERQIYRLKAEVRAKGPLGIVHGNQGKTSKRKTPAELEDRIVTLARSKYHDFNDHHFTEKLQAEENIFLSRETVRCLLRAKGIGPKRKRRPPKHRRRRERKPQEGMMLQLDGSHHRWLPGQEEEFCLLLAVDDATKYPWARLEKAETTHGYFRLLSEIVKAKGLPLSVYADKHSIFRTERTRPTLEEQLTGKTPQTQLARALKELGITLIPAHSPQAKGRVERAFSTFQDRLLAELRLAQVQNLDQANAALKKFLPSYRRRFTLKAPSAWRPLPEKFDPNNYFCRKENRSVGNDNCFAFEGQRLQLPANGQRSSWAKAQIEVRQLTDGSLKALYQGEIIARFPKPKATNEVSRRLEGSGRAPNFCATGTRRETVAPKKPLGNYAAP